MMRLKNSFRLWMENALLYGIGNYRNSLRKFVLFKTMEWLKTGDINWTFFKGKNVKKFEVQKQITNFSTVKYGDHLT